MVNTVTLLVDMLPDDRFVIVTDSPANSVNDSTDSLPTEAPLDAKEAFRNHTIKEIVETERKFVADLEALQVFDTLRQPRMINLTTTVTAIRKCTGAGQRHFTGYDTSSIPWT